MEAILQLTLVSDKDGKPEYFYWTSGGYHRVKESSSGSQ
jgi:hypothetical protein